MNARILGQLAAALEHLGHLDERGVGGAATSPISLVSPMAHATVSNEAARDMLMPIMASFAALKHSISGGAAGSGAK